MKSLKRSLLLLALCLVPALTFAAPDSSVAPASEVGGGDALEAGSFGVCSEASQAVSGTPLGRGSEHRSGGFEECDALQDGKPTKVSTPLERNPARVRPALVRRTYQGHPRVSRIPGYQTYAGEICPELSLLIIRHNAGVVQLYPERGRGESAETGHGALRAVPGTTEHHHVTSHHISHLVSPSASKHWHSAESLPAPQKFRLTTQRPPKCPMPLQRTSQSCWGWSLL